jgi:transcriptional regulator with XRE-family HTH domain
MITDYNKDLAPILKRQRLLIPLTLRQLSARSGVSSSHLGRIERGERLPSAYTLRKIAKPLGFDENELFMLAGFLSYRAPAMAEEVLGYSGGQLDPYVASVLSQEPIEVQRTVIGILSILKSLAKRVEKEE